MKKREEIARMEDIPNVGPAMAADLRQLGIMLPTDLPGRDPYAMYDDLCRITGQAQQRAVVLRAEQHEPARPGHRLDLRPRPLGDPARCESLVHARLEAPQLPLEGRGHVPERLV